MQRAIVVARADGNCEERPLINTLSMHSGRLTWHHVFGRGHIIAEPWASWHPLTTMLCIQDHMDVHVDAQLRRIIEWAAIERFVIAVNWQTRFWENGDWTPIEIIKTMIRELESDGRKADDYI